MSKTTENTEKIFITKVKMNNDGTAKIWYKATDDESSREVQFKRDEPVTEIFAEAFQNGADGFFGCIPLLSADASNISMSEIRFDYDGAGKLDKALYGVKYAFNEANNAVINISTPLIPIDREELAGCFTISGKHITDLQEIIKQAKAYINGETRIKQGTLELVKGAK